MEQNKFSMTANSVSNLQHGQFLITDLGYYLKMFWCTWRPHHGSY